MPVRLFSASLHGSVDWHYGTVQDDRPTDGDSASVEIPRETHESGFFGRGFEASRVEGREKTLCAGSSGPGQRLHRARQTRIRAENMAPSGLSRTRRVASMSFGDRVCQKTANSAYVIG